MISNVGPIRSTENRYGLSETKNIATHSKSTQALAEYEIHSDSTRKAIGHFWFYSLTCSLVLEFNLREQKKGAEVKPW